VGSEVQRASDADRERFVSHLSYLFSEGYITTKAEVDQLREQLIEARSLKTLNDTLSGFPQPPVPERPRDWGIPERWAPVTIAIAILGVFIAAVPTTALAHHGDSVANTLTAVFLVTGMVTIIAAIITSICAGIAWDNAGQFDRERRRSLDRNRRIRDRAN